ncbi:uncharacterized protein [Zea mays]|jgi:hypothetical protein|uniref:Uncharacterized protein n=1 Tax=Zea mays TaxID=4577 RepID=K7VQV4_MAIZE|nr:uncharacterized protein LOC103637907 [Zea mays]AQL01271.1 hypothetical protein ZEAMMB73_Zm00001d044986 [Zea mays]|eukprot:XP_020399779.1 uncharacterized protein LOC103637907 [Zea mays]
MGNVEATTTSSIVAPELLLGDALLKVAVFAVVQALVYLILRKSSGVFAPAAGMTARSFSFRPMRSMSVRRVLAAFSDVPVGVPESEDRAPSPSPMDPGAEPASE